MGQLHFEDRIILWLYDSSHGHHNYPHIHIKWSDGKNASYKINGELIIGSNRDNKLISSYIKSHQKEIDENLMLLRRGKELKKILTKIYK